jgi:2-polyprenyl-3-methyl-5-hydroxy-6-metoxy-1,4-benzoquinol methylase
VDLRERQGDNAPRHPWEVVRCRFFLEVLARHGALDRGADWLDVGAGDAWTGGQLRRRLPASATVVGWDINYRSDDLDRRVQPLGMSLTATRPPGPFGGLLLLDVIEHVSDDRAFVGEIVAGLAEPAAWVLVSVPAHPVLFSDHDRFLHHYRRYRPRQCLDVLEGAGVEVLASGGVFHALLGVRALQVAAARISGRPGPTGGVGTWSRGPAVTAVVTGALGLDTRISLLLAGKGRNLPGLSYWALGRRRR